MNMYCRMMNKKQYVFFMSSRSGSKCFVVVGVVSGMVLELSKSRECAGVEPMCGENGNHVHVAWRRWWRNRRGGEPSRVENCFFVCFDKLLKLWFDFGFGHFYHLYQLNSDWFYVYDVYRQRIDLNSDYPLRDIFWLECTNFITIQYCFWLFSIK